MDVSPKKLEALRVLARTGHFGRAAEALGLSQPTLSRHIQTLEDELGYQLFDRHTRAVSLTPMGHEVVAYARRLEAFQTRAAARLEARSSGHLGHVVVAAVPSIVGLLIAPVLRDLEAIFPRLAVEVLDYPSPQIREAVRMEQVDIGLDSPIDQSSEELVAERLLADPLGVAVAKDHPLADRVQIRIPDLAGHTLVGTNRGSSLRYLVDQSFMRFDREFQPRYVFAGLLPMLEFASAGLGAAILPINAGYTVPENCARIPLIDATERVTYMYTRKHSSLDPAVSHVMAVLRMKAANLSDRTTAKTA